MTKHLLAVLVLALTLGFAASLGTGTGRSAEAANNPAITTESVVNADQCTSTQTDYGYGGYGYGYGYGYGTTYGNPYGYGIYGGFYQPIVPGPNYGQIYSVYSCNQTQCQPAPYNASYAICPGPAAGITVSGSTSSTCASAENISAYVVDANGLRVADGTEVNFSTTFGMITAVAQTQDGTATAALNTPTKQTGTAVITITTGNASAGITVNVSCNVPGSYAAGQGQYAPAAPAAPASSGPSYYGYGY